LVALLKAPETEEESEAACEEIELNSLALTEESEEATEDAAEVTEEATDAPEEEALTMAAHSEV